MNIEINIAEALGMKEPEPAAEKPETEQEQPGIKIALWSGGNHVWKKAASAEALEAEMKQWAFNEGDCYHCLSFGIVDSLTYLKLLLQRQAAKYVAISTWRLLEEDVREIFLLWEKGRIGRVDFYIGDTLRETQPDAYREIKRLLPECGGRMAVFKNHSKILAIEGEEFDVLVESSANINTKPIPRCENTVVTVSRELVSHYIDLFGEIHPQNKEDQFAPPYKKGSL